MSCPLTLSGRLFCIFGFLYMMFMARYCSGTISVATDLVDFRSY
jgi:hypothetical protein